jgi:NADH-quinone oxidoreductase subunit N
MNYDWIIGLKSELLTILIIVVLLMIKLGKGMRNSSLLQTTQILLLINLALAFGWNGNGFLFGNAFQVSQLFGFEKAILIAGVYLLLLVHHQWLEKQEHLPEFLVLMLSALLGMQTMISSGNFLLLYLSLELATIPVAAMANFDLDKKRSSEAAMKMILSSALSSGILLMGISLLYGATGTIGFEALPQALKADNGLHLLSLVMIFAAFAFKLSAVPFHLWTADVYEGSPMPVTAFLSVVSKGAVAFVLTSTFYRAFQPMFETWYQLLAIIGLITIIIGNLFAIRQENIKRMLAFSSIAQVGFVLIGISANSPAGLASVIYFVLIYVFSNIAAFGVAAVIAAQTGSEQINAYKGLYANNKMLTWIMALALFSLAGIPPTAGFFGKFFLLTAGAVRADFWLVIIAALNMMVSLYYYLRVVRNMFSTEATHPALTVPVTVKLGLYLCVAGILITGVAGWIYDYIAMLNR